MYCRRRGETNLLTSQKQRVWQFVQRHHTVSAALSRIVVMTTLVAVVILYTFGSPLFRASAQAASCAAGDTAYTVAAGDTLSTIASRNQTTWQQLAQHNNITDVNEIYVGQTICLASGTSEQNVDQQSQQIQATDMQTTDEQATDGQADITDAAAPAPIKGTGNYFPAGQCTWWANQRYYQLHHIYVPWTTNSDAWRWTIQARNFHWLVSTKPSVGSIIDLQPWVQGAYGLGHVAVVEKLLPNGHVIASNMNWGGSHSVVYVNFVAGPGVTFIRF
jgi:surface antigen